MDVDGGADVTVLQRLSHRGPSATLEQGWWWSSSNPWLTKPLEQLNILTKGHPRHDQAGLPPTRSRHRAMTVRGHQRSSPSTKANCRSGSILAAGSLPREPPGSDRERPEHRHQALPMPHCDPLAWAAGVAEAATVFQNMLQRLDTLTPLKEWSQSFWPDLNQSMLAFEKRLHEVIFGKL